MEAWDGEALIIRCLGFQRILYEKSVDGLRGDRVRPSSEGKVDVVAGMMHSW